MLNLPFDSLDLIYLRNVFFNHIEFRIILKKSNAHKLILILNSNRILRQFLIYLGEGAQW